jgi:hypothetical protein
VFTIIIERNGVKLAQVVVPDNGNSDVGNIASSSPQAVSSNMLGSVYPGVATGAGPGSGVTGGGPGNGVLPSGPGTGVTGHGHPHAVVTGAGPGTGVTGGGPGTPVTGGGPGTPVTGGGSTTSGPIITISL